MLPNSKKYYLAKKLIHNGLLFSISRVLLRNKIDEQKYYIQIACKRRDIYLHNQENTGIMYCSLNKSNILAYSLWRAPLSWVIEGGIKMQDRKISPNRYPRRSYSLAQGRLGLGRPPGASNVPRDRP